MCTVRSSIHLLLEAGGGAWSRGCVPGPGGAWSQRVVVPGNGGVPGPRGNGWYLSMHRGRPPPLVDRQTGAKT